MELLPIFVSLGFGIFISLYYLYSSEKKEQKIKKILSKNNTDRRPFKRVYVREEDGNLNFFVDWVYNKKIYYDTLRTFDLDHQPPAHIEFSFNTTLGYLRVTRMAYVSRKKFDELVSLP